MRGTRAAGAVDNESAQILVARPLHVGFTLNSDTPYLGSGLDLRKGGPLVIELPAVPLVGLLDDHYHRWLVDLGPRGGKVLLLPAGHEGELPPESEGYEVVRSDTWQVLCALPLSEDADAANRLLAVGGGRCGDGGGVVPGRFRSGRRGPPPPSAGQDRTGQDDSDDGSASVAEAVALGSPHPTWRGRRTGVVRWPGVNGGGCRASQLEVVPHPGSSGLGSPAWLSPPS
ncbi:DUF1254 domain-containing protein [Streptomyces sp. NPDC012756]|uniref:DUF1254 domain-containing protein n=1 Tax=Streptomyces sp. NPDC012756 TaxID=3364847 RepID=UPI0036766319